MWIKWNGVKSRPSAWIIHSTTDVNALVFSQADIFLCFPWFVIYVVDNNDPPPKKKQTKTKHHDTKARGECYRSMQRCSDANDESALLEGEHQTNLQCYYLKIRSDDPYLLFDNYHQDILLSWCQSFHVDTRRFGGEEKVGQFTRISPKHPFVVHNFLSVIIFVCALNGIIISLHMLREPGNTRLFLRCSTSYTIPRGLTNILGGILYRDRTYAGAYRERHGNIKRSLHWRHYWNRAFGRRVPNMQVVVLF